MGNDAGAREFVRNYTFTDADLWALDGRPKAEHIRQNGIGDCYLVSAAGAVALRTPEVFERAIAYDPETSTFSVRLCDEGRWRTIPVTQNELRSNVIARGGSNFDDTLMFRGQGAIWPAVVEVGYAKMKWGSWEAGLEQLKKGGDPGAALTVLTGDERLRIPGSELYTKSDAQVVSEIDRQIASGKRILFNTNEQTDLDIVRFTPVARDGLSGNHSYMLVGARLDEKGEAIIRLRNPHGRNTDLDWKTGHEDAEIEVRWKDLKRYGFFERALHSLDIASVPDRERALLEAIRNDVGDRADDRTLAAATLRSVRDGIDTVDKYARATIGDDGTLWVAGKTPGYRASVAADESLSPARESFEALTQAGRERELVLSQQREMSLQGSKVLS